MKLIPLSGGKAFAKVDDEWFEVLNRYKWIVTKLGYAYRMARPGHGVMMHRVIAMVPAGLETDHINGDKLDNRCANLRVCTHAENNTGVKKPKKHSDFPYVGVTKSGNRFRAEITANKKHVGLGSFATAEEAARAYDQAAIKFHKTFARLNFPQETCS